MLSEVVSRGLNREQGGGQQRGGYGGGQQQGGFGGGGYGGGYGGQRDNQMGGGYGGQGGYNR